jgi:hypothetical protein
LALKHTTNVEQWQGDSEKVYDFIYLRQHSSLPSNSNFKCKYLQNCRDCVTLE